MDLNLITFIGLAVVYGVSASGVLICALWLFKCPHPWRLFAFLCATLTFVFLTQHPFPALGALTCPVASAEPQLLPFRFIETFGRLDRRGALLLDYLTNRELVATVANFLICVVIGLSLVRHIKTWVGIAVFAATLTLIVELTQLTGTWGLYPCAYRQFNVDDLIMNALGVLVGAMLMRRWRKRA